MSARPDCVLHARSREEIVNACGIDDFHDGVNYTRTACVIAVSKARDLLEPFLHQVRLPVCRSRTPHAAPCVVRRQSPPQGHRPPRQGLGRGPFSAMQDCMTRCWLEGGSFG